MCGRGGGWLCGAGEQLVEGLGAFFQPWYDLTADTQDELHAFAAQLGIPRQGFEPGPLVGVQPVSVSWRPSHSPAPIVAPGDGLAARPAAAQPPA
jgi:hypothetical protein